MASGQKDFLLSLIRDGKEMTFGQQLKLTMLLAVPAILAQFSSVLMLYIDTAMVGHLGANPSASIGLVTTSTWILGGFTMAIASGFAVQVAHMCGAKNFEGARRVLRQGLSSIFMLSLVFGLVGVAISPFLPAWLGGSEAINADASAYFRIYAAFVPIGAVGYGANAMLQGSGNMKVPSILYVSMCSLDVVLNYLFIYLMEMGVAGAALGTGLAETLTTIVSLWFVLRRSTELKIVGERGSFVPTKTVLINAFGITGPMWLQNLIMRGAHVASTLIVAPLGPIAIAANAFAITAESFCYMPGYGLQEAATTLVGQSLGASRKHIARRFARITIWMADLHGGADVYLRAGADDPVEQRSRRDRPRREGPAHRSLRRDLLCGFDRRLRRLCGSGGYPHPYRPEFRKHVGGPHRPGALSDAPVRPGGLLDCHVHRTERTRPALPLPRAGGQVDAKTLYAGIKQ